MGTRILLVDDNPDMLATLSLVLGSEGYEVATAQHGLDAQEQLAAGPLPALIVLDLQMPVMDGQTFLRTLPVLGIPGATDVPVLVSTASSNVAVEGAAGTLRKPYELDELLDAVRRLT